MGTSPSSLNTLRVRAKTIPPAPSEEFVNTEFRRILADRGVPEAVIAEKIRIENLAVKWYQVFSDQQKGSLPNTAPTDVERLDSWTPEVYVDELLLATETSDIILLLKAIRENMSLYSRAWTLDFLNEGGVEALSMFLPQEGTGKIRSKRAEIYQHLLRTYMSLANFKEGLDKMISSPGVLLKILFCLHTESHVLQTFTLQVLGVACYSCSRGHQLVLQCLQDFKVIKNEPVRFYLLMKTLKERKTPSNIKANLLTFINILVNSALYVEERISIRADFIYLGIGEFIDIQRSLESQYPLPAELKVQMDVFDRSMQTDREQTVHQEVDLTNLDQLFDELYTRTASSDVQDVFLSIMQQLLLIPSDRVIGKQLWVLLDKLTKEVAATPLTATTTDFSHNLSLEEKKKLLDIRAQIEKATRQRSDTEKRQPSVTSPLSPPIVTATNGGDSSCPSPLRRKNSQEDREERRESARKRQKSGDGQTDKFASSNAASADPLSSAGMTKITVPRRAASALGTVDASSLFSILSPSSLSTSKPEQALPTAKATDIRPTAPSPKLQEANNDTKTDVCAKYRKMLALHIPREKVELKMKMDGVDTSLLDAPEHPVTIAVEKAHEQPQQPSEPAISSKTMREHPAYAKYFKLLSMGMSKEHLKLKMQAENLDPSVLESPDKPWNDQSSGSKDGSVAMIMAKDHPKYTKYFKLVSMGMPFAQAKLKMALEKLDSSLLERPDELMPAPGGENQSDNVHSSQPPPKPSSEAPPGNVTPRNNARSALMASLSSRAGVIKKDEKGQTQETLSSDFKTIKASEHPSYAKYFKLLKMGMPLEQIKLKMSAEKLQTDLLSTPDALLSLETDTPTTTSTAPAKDHPKYAKYFRLVRMNMPREQIILKMQSEQADPAILDTPELLLPLPPSTDSSSQPITSVPSSSVLSPVSSELKRKSVTMKEDPTYAKYFKLLSIGMPRDHVKGKMAMDGVDPSILDRPEEESKIASPSLLSPLPSTIVQEKTMDSHPALEGQAPFKTTTEVTSKAPTAAQEPTPPVSTSVPILPLLAKPRVPNPRVQLRNVYWEPVAPQSLQGTIWEEIAKSEESLHDTSSVSAAASDTKLVIDDDFHFDVDTLESQFAKAPAPGGALALSSSLAGQHPGTTGSESPLTGSAKIGVESAAGDGTRTPTTSQGRLKRRLSFIEPARANTVGIMISQFKVPPARIREIILKLDETFLTFERVQSLHKLLPTEEEAQGLQSYKGDGTDLTEADRFFLEIQKIPRLPSRLESLMVKMQFETRAAESEKSFHDVVLACQQVSSSHDLKTLLRLVLKIGNFLNAGTARGSAWGFKLSYLTKLRQMKGADKSTTLMHVLAKKLREKKPKLLSFFSSQLSSVDRVTTLSLDILHAELKSLQSGLKTVEKELSAMRMADERVAKQRRTSLRPDNNESVASDASHGNTTGISSQKPDKKEEHDGKVTSLAVEPTAKVGEDAFVPVMSEFVMIAGTTVGRLQVAHARAADEFSRTVQKFGENPADKTVTLEYFFKCIYDFAMDLQMADEENERIRVAEERRQRREQEAKQRLEDRLHKASTMGHRTSIARSSSASLLLPSGNKLKGVIDSNTIGRRGNDYEPANDVISLDRTQSATSVSSNSSSISSTLFALNQHQIQSTVPSSSASIQLSASALEDSKSVSRAAAGTLSSQTIAIEREWSGTSVLSTATVNSTVSADLNEIVEEMEGGLKNFQRLRDSSATDILRAYHERRETEHEIRKRGSKELSAALATTLLNSSSTGATSPTRKQSLTQRIKQGVSSFSPSKDREYSALPPPKSGEVPAESPAIEAPLNKDAPVQSLPTLYLPDDSSIQLSRSSPEDLLHLSVSKSSSVVLETRPEDESLSVLSSGRTSSRREQHPASTKANELRKGSGSVKSPAPPSTSSSSFLNFFRRGSRQSTSRKDETDRGEKDHPGRKESLKAKDKTSETERKKDSKTTLSPTALQEYQEEAPRRGELDDKLVLIKDDNSISSSSLLSSASSSSSTSLKRQQQRQQKRLEMLMAAEIDDETEGEKTSAAYRKTANMTERRFSGSDPMRLESVAQGMSGRKLNKS